MIGLSDYQVSILLWLLAFAGLLLFRRGTGIGALAGLVFSIALVTIAIQLQLKSAAANGPSRLSRIALTLTNVIGGKLGAPMFRTFHDLHQPPPPE